MSKYTEAIEEMQLSDFLRSKDAEVVWLTMKSIQTIREALEIADRLERTDVNRAIGNYEPHLLKPIEIVCFANGYEQALKDVRGEVMAEYINAADIVRCGECKHIDKTVCLTSFPEKYICKIDNKPHTVNWFCADGERKSDGG